MNRTVHLAARSLVLALLLAPVGVVGVGVESAWAQEAPMFASGLFVDLPVGEVIGDGATPVLVHVLALNAAGAPITAYKPKITVLEGVVGPWTEIGGGLYSFEYTPPAVDNQRAVVARIRGKTAEKVALELDVEIQVTAPRSRRVSATANPPQIVLGQDPEATLSFVLDGASGQPLKGADLLVSASVGEVVNVTDMGAGRFTAKFVPPKVNFPQLAIVTVADRRDPTRTYGSVVIPLQGKTDYPIKTTPNASVVLNIGGRDYGPAQAAADGRASVPIIVSPGVGKATLTTRVNGVTNQEPIDLRIPETRRLRMLPLHGSLPSDGTLKVPVRVVVRNADGTPDSTAKVNFTATTGTIGQAVHEGDGVYRADFVPASGNVQADASITATLAGSTVQTDTRAVTLVPLRPASLALTAEPTSLSPSTTTFKVFAKVLGPDGRGLAQRELLMNAAGAKLKAPVGDLRNGDYRADFTTTGSGPVELIATVQTPGTGNPLRRVVVFSTRPNLPNDGLSSAMLTVLTLDEFGYPVPSVPVALQLERGDGSIPGTVTTNVNGIGQVFYTAGRKADLIRIRATAGDHVTGIAMMQVPNNGPKLELPRSGTVDARALVEKWKPIVTSIRIEREGQTGALITDRPTAIGGGVVASITAKPEPAVVAPGGSVVLIVKAVDAEGRGVAGQTLDLLSSVGRFGVVSDMGGGEYEIALTVPADAKGEAKVSIASADGAASTFLKVPVQADAAATASGWGGSGTTAGTTTGGTTPPVTAAVTPPPVAVTPPAVVDPAKPEKPEKVKPEGGGSDYGDSFRLRVAGVGSTYSYAQSPEADPGPLLPVALQWGGEAGGAASPFGAEAGVRWFPGANPYVAAHVGTRVTRYGVSAAVFGDQVAPDWLLDLKAQAVVRYPVVVGDDAVISAGLRGGFRYSDFIVFRGCLDAGCEVLYETLPVPTGTVGVEFGVEAGPVYALVEGELGFPGLTSVEANLGFKVTENLGIDLGFEAMSRQVPVVGASTRTTFGELTDAQTMGKIGLSWSI